MCSCYRPGGVPVPLRNKDYVTTLRLLQRFKHRKAAIQTNLKVKCVWNSVRYTGTKQVSPQNSATPTRPIYCNSTNYLLIVFSKSNPLPSPHTYKNPRSIPDLTTIVDNCHN